MKEVLLEVKNLKKYFPIVTGLFRREVGQVKAVDDVSFNISSGEVFGIVGESGSGKSTVARAAIRLIEPTDGEIYYRQLNLREQKPRELRNLRQEIQVIFQDPLASLNPRKTIFINVGEALLYHKKVENKQQCYEAVVKNLDLVGLSKDAINRYPHEFSGGQQQRICIARAIALNPKLIICDEIVSALDVSVQAQILNLLSDLKDELGLSYLFISHDLAVVRHICDNILVLYKGKTVEVGPTEDIFTNPKHPYTKNLLNAIPTNFPKAPTSN